LIPHKTVFVIEGWKGKRQNRNFWLLETAPGNWDESIGSYGVPSRVNIIIEHPG